MDAWEEEEEVLETVGVLVEVMVLVVVFVEVEELVRRLEGADDFDRVVVLVEVFEAVDVPLGATRTLAGNGTSPRETLSPVKTAPSLAERRPSPKIKNRNKRIVRAAIYLN